MGRRGSVEDVGLARALVQFGLIEAIHAGRLLAAIADQALGARRQHLALLAQLFDLLFQFWNTLGAKHNPSTR